MFGRERSRWRDPWPLGARLELLPSLCLERARRIIRHSVSPGMPLGRMRESRMAQEAT